MVKIKRKTPGPNGRNLRATVDLVGSIRLILSTSEIERQAVAGGGKIVDELIRGRLTDRLAFLDLARSFSRVLFLRASPRREDECPEGERNWKKRCCSSHASLPIERR